MRSIVSYAATCGLAVCMLAPGTHARAQTASIAAIVNGAIITKADVTARTRLFALSAGLPAGSQTLKRLRPQISRELIDQALQLQAIERNKIVVSESRIVAALKRVNAANHLPPNGLQQKLARAGVPLSTLVSQFRTQLGWTDVLHKKLGSDLRPTPDDIKAAAAAMKKEIGKTQYHVAEIFIPIDAPADRSSARHFANVVIRQLRAGAPFPVVAAQFSQSESALTGGDRGWVQPNLLDPAVQRIVEKMPVGAISDPVRVAGGFEIVHQLGIRKFGVGTKTILSIRQVFLKFSTPFAGGQPNASQLAVLKHANTLRGRLHDCSAVEAANKAAGSVEKSNPGPVNMATVRPAAFRNLLAKLPIGKASQPLVSHNGIAIVMVCSRQTSKLGLPGKKAIARKLIQRRVSLESQRLMDTLRRNAVIQHIATH